MFLDACSSIAASYPSFEDPSSYPPNHTTPPRTTLTRFLPTGFRFNRFHQPLTNWDQVSHSPKMFHTFPPFLVDLPTNPSNHLATELPEPTRCIFPRKDWTQASGSTAAASTVTAADDGFDMFGHSIPSIPWRQMTSLPSGFQGENLVWRLRVYRLYHANRYTLTRRMSGRRCPPEKMKGLIVNSSPSIGSPLKKFPSKYLYRAVGYIVGSEGQYSCSWWIPHEAAIRFHQACFGSLKRYSVKLQLQAVWDKDATGKCWPFGHHFSADSV